MPLLSSSSKSLKPCSSKHLPVIFAWSILLSTSFTYGIIILPEITRILNMMIFIPISHCLLFIFLCSNFLLATFLDPGVYEQSLKNEYTHIIRSADKDDSHPYSLPLKSVHINGSQINMKYCTTCKFFRPPRCSHCSICECCIDSFDHHCPWLNNCVARRNYRYFFQFLCLLCVHMILIFSFCLYYIMVKRNSSSSSISRVDSLQSNTSSSNYFPLTYFSDYRLILCIILLIIIVLMVIPIGGLTCFHIYLISKGRTTNEHVTKKYQEKDNPFNYGCVMNFFRILCLPLYPKLTVPKIKLYNRMTIQKSQQNKDISTTRVIYKIANNKANNNDVINNNSNKSKTINKMEGHVELNDDQQDNVMHENHIELKIGRKKQSTIKQSNLYINPIENHVKEQITTENYKSVPTSKRHYQVNYFHQSTSINNRRTPSSTNSLDHPIIMLRQSPSIVSSSFSNFFSTSPINIRAQQQETLLKELQSTDEDLRQIFLPSSHRSVSNMSLSSKFSYDNVQDSETIYNENNDDGGTYIMISRRFSENSSVMNNHKPSLSVSNMQHYNDDILYKSLKTNLDRDNSSNKDITSRNESYRQAQPAISFSYDYPSYHPLSRQVILNMSHEKLVVRRLDEKYLDISV